MTTSTVDTRADGTRADGDAAPSKFEQLKARYPWLDHLVRAGGRYTEKHGDHYAAAITYFSILALVPLLMIAFAAAAFVLANNAALLGQIQAGITNAAPPGLGDLLNKVIQQAIAQRNAVGILGLLGALYSGLGWMANMREALSEQWDQRGDPPPIVKRYGGDLVAMIGLGLALALSFAVTAVAPTPGARPTVTAGRTTTGAGSGISSGSFSVIVAAQAVTKRMNRETKFAKTSRPMMGPKAAPAGEFVTLEM